MPRGYVSPKKKKEYIQKGGAKGTGKTIVSAGPGTAGTKTVSTATAVSDWGGGAPSRASAIKGTPTTTTASGRLSAIRKARQDVRQQARELVDGNVTFDKTDGLPKLAKSAVENIVRETGASAKDLEGVSLPKKVEKKVKQQEAKTRAKETLDKTYAQIVMKQEDSPRRILPDPNKTSRRYKEKVVAGVSRADWSRAKKDQLPIVADISNPWQGVKQGSKKERKALYAQLRQGKSELLPSVAQQKADAKNEADILGQLIPDTPIEQALLFAGGGAGLLKAARGAERLATGVRAAKAGEEGLSTLQATKQVAAATKTGKALKAARKVSRPAGVVGTAGVVGAAAKTGNITPNVKAIAEASPKEAIPTTLRGFVGIPMAVASGAANLLVSGTRAAEIPFTTDPRHKSAAYAAAPTKRWGAENVAEAKRMFETLTSKDPEAIKRAIENDYGYLPYLAGGNLLRIPGTAALRGATKAPTKLAREAVDSARTMKTGETWMRKRRPRAEGTEAPPVFPKLANRAPHRQIKRRLSRESNRRVETYAFGGRRFEKATQKANVAAGRTVNRKLAKLQKRIAIRDKEFDVPIRQGDLAMYLGAEARFSTRSRAEALKQIDMRIAELDRAGAPKNIPERYQLEALKAAPELLTRPPAKGRLTREQRAAAQFWQVADQYREMAKTTPGVLREKSAREVIDAAAVRTLEPKSKLEAPTFTLDKRLEARQASIDTARKANRKGQRHTQKLEKDVAVKRAKVKKLREGESARLSSLETLDADKKLRALDVERDMLREARKQPPEKVAKLRSEAAALRAEANKTKGKGAPAKRKKLRAEAKKKDKAATAAMDAHRKEITRLLGQNSTARKGITTARSERSGGRPKELANAEASLARAEGTLNTHKAQLKTSIAETRARQNLLTGRLNKSERRAVLASLPDNATPGRKYAALAEARIRKLEAATAREIGPIRRQFDRDMAAAMDKFGIERSSFIVHRNRLDREGIGTAGSFQRIATRKDLRRTGSMRAKGDVVYDYKAAVDTIQGAAMRESQARLSQALIEDSALKRQMPDGEKKLYTKKEAHDMLQSGEIRHGDYKFVRAGMLDTEEGRAKVLSPKDERLSPEPGSVAAIRDQINTDTREFRMAEKFDAKGQGERGYLIKASDVDYTLDSMKSLEKIFKTMSEINGWGSRAVLNTSFAWMMAQPVAEMLVLLLSHTNPVRLTRAIKMVKRAHDDPALARSIAMGSDSALTPTSIKSGAKQYMGATHDAVKATKQSPIGAIARQIGTLELPAYIDRAKGGWIRKVGYVAEVDRELNSTVRQFSKAFSGVMDDMEAITAKLRKMDRRDQLVYLDSAAGRKLAERFQNNLDDMLGNWTALGPVEKELAQLVFFYPFMRFSIDWTFRAFPKRHPVRFAILSSMSQWNAEQLEQFLTEKPSFFSQWATAPIYGSETGPPTSFMPFQRATPGGNVATELFGEADSLGELSKGFAPAIGIPFRAVFNYDSFGKPKDQFAFGQEEPPSIFNDLNPINLGGNLVEQLSAMPFPVRYAQRQLGNRNPQPGDEAPSDILGLGKVDTYGLRSGVFPFAPQDYRQSKIRADVSGAYDKRTEGFYQKNTGGEEYSKLNKKFETKPDWWSGGTPAEQAQWKKYWSTKKIRQGGTEKVDKANAKLRALYKQEGVAVPDSLKAEPTGPEWARKSGGLSKAERAEVDKIFGGAGKTPANKHSANIGSTAPDGKATPHRAQISREIRNSTREIAGPKGYGLRTRKDGTTLPLSDPMSDPRTQVKKTKKGNIVTSYRGRRVMGDVTLSSVAKAEKNGTLDLAPNGQITTPQVRQALAAGNRAEESIAEKEKQIAKLQSKTGGVPSGVPDKYRASVKKWGAYLEKRMKANGLVGVTGGLPPGMSGAEYLAKILQAESGWSESLGPENTSSAGAKGLGQFIESTRASFLSQFGVDAYGNADQQIKAAAFHLDGDHTAGGLESYNPGYGDWGYYLNQDVGQVASGDPKAAKKIKALNGQIKGIAQKANKSLKPIGLDTVDPEPADQTISWKEKPAQKKRGAWAGTQKILEKAARGIEISSTKRTPEENAAVGGSTTSDHLTTNDTTYAVDLPASGEAGTNIAQKMYQRLKLNEPLAIGTYNWYTSRKYPGYRFQVLWQVEGHFDHVHVGSEWTGENLPAGTYAGGAVGGSTGGTTGSVAPSGGGVTPSGGTGQMPGQQKQKASKWQLLQDFRAQQEPTDTPVESTDTTLDLSAAENIANLPALTKKKKKVLLP